MIKLDSDKNPRENLQRLIDAPLRILEWQILSTNPELYGREETEYLAGEIRDAWERKDYRRIKALSSKQLLFKRCEAVGAEEAFFGRKLDESQRKAFGSAVCSDVNDAIERSKEYEKKAEWEESIGVIDRILAAIGETENKTIETELKAHLATLLWQCPMGDRAENLERAIELYREVSKVFTRQAFPEYWAMIQNNLANTYLVRIRGDRADNLEVTIELFEQALAVVTRSDFPEHWATTRYNLANTYLLRIHGDHGSNLERAIDLFRSVLDVRTRNSFPEDWARVQNSLALACYERLQGDPGENIEEAIGLFQGSLEIFSRDVFPLHWARTQNNLAKSYMSRRDGSREENIETAIQLIENTLDVFSRQTYPEYWARVLFYLARAEMRLATTGRTGCLERAVEHLNQALEVQIPQAFPRECRETSILLAEAHILCGRWDDALGIVNRAREADRLLQRQTTSLTGKSHEIEESAALYYLASLASAHQGDLIGSVEWLEQGKTRELDESLMRDQAIFASNLKEADRKEYTRKLERLRALEAEQRGTLQTTRAITEVTGEARRLHSALDRLIEKIQAYEPDFLREITVNQEKIRSILREEGIAYLVFNVTRHGTVITLLVSLSGAFFSESFFIERFTLDVMAGLVNEWSTMLEKLRGGAASTIEGRRMWWKEIDEIGRRTYHQILSPVHEWLVEKGGEIRELVLVPHLSLHVLPLHLARYDQNGKPRYLIEDYLVSYLPSLSVILASAGTEKRTHDGIPRRGKGASESSRMLLVCDPIGDLVWSREEASRVEKYFSGRKRVMAGRAASKGEVLRVTSGIQYLHFSGHGEFDPVDPWSSGLILAGEESEGGQVPEEIVETVRTRNRMGHVILEERSYPDGGGERVIYDQRGVIRSRVRSLPDGARYLPGRGRLLTLREIFSDMDLSDTELVVLSACESGLVGYGGRSDEFVGLPGGFIRAGARRVVASLWVVDDEATATLMDLFYRFLLVDRYTPAMALKTAQLEIKKNPRWRNPFYWGAFRILGD